MISIMNAARETNKCEHVSRNNVHLNVCMYISCQTVAIPGQLTHVVDECKRQLLCGVAVAKAFSLGGKGGRPSLWVI